MRVFNPLAVLLAYILLRVYMLKKVFVQKNFFEIVSQCRKLSNSAENTLFHILLHWNELYSILIHWAELYPILIHWTEPYLNNYRRQPIKFESSANQNRLLRHPRALGSGGGPFLALDSSRLAIAHLNTWGPPAPTWSAHYSTTIVNQWNLKKYWSSTKLIHNETICKSLTSMNKTITFMELHRTML